MKKYLFGLGAMLVGAGLMFVLMHGEVSAEGDSNAIQCKMYETGRTGAWVEVCEINDLICATRGGATLSCLKK